MVSQGFGTRDCLSPVVSLVVLVALLRTSTRAGRLMLVVVVGISAGTKDVARARSCAFARVVEVL